MRPSPALLCLVALLALALALPALAGEIGRLVLASTPSAKVEIDGAAYGTTGETHLDVKLPPGTYRVRFICDHGDCEPLARKTGVKTLVVEADKETRYTTDFFALNGPPAERTARQAPGPHPATAAEGEASGTLMLSSRPVCDVEIDGVSVGTTDDTRRGLELAPGTYRVRYVCSHADCDDFARKSGVKTLKVEAGKTTRYVADFFVLNQR